MTKKLKGNVERKQRTGGGQHAKKNQHVNVTEPPIKSLVLPREEVLKAFFSAIREDLNKPENERQFKQDFYSAKKNIEFTHQGVVHTISFPLQFQITHGRKPLGDEPRRVEGEVQESPRTAPRGQKIHLAFYSNNKQVTKFSGGRHCTPSIRLAALTCTFSEGDSGKIEKIEGRSNQRIPIAFRSGSVLLPHTHLKHPRMIKSILAVKSDDKKREAIEKEQTLLECLGYSNRPVTWDGNDAAISMYVVGDMSLTEFIEQRKKAGKFDATFFFELINQFNLALTALHIKLVHFDIKSDNVQVKVEDDGSFTLSFIDVGSAYSVDQIAAKQKDQALPIKGTYEYIAPEAYMPFSKESEEYRKAMSKMLVNAHLRGQSPGPGQSANTTPAFDIFSMGATLYKLLMNKEPDRDEFFGIDLKLLNVGNIKNRLGCGTADAKLIIDLLSGMVALDPEKRLTSGQISRLIEPKIKQFDEKNLEDDIVEIPLTDEKPPTVAGSSGSFSDFGNILGLTKDENDLKKDDSPPSTPIPISKKQKNRSDETKEPAISSTHPSVNSTGGRQIPPIPSTQPKTQANKIEGQRDKKFDAILDDLSEALNKQIKSYEKRNSSFGAFFHRPIDEGKKLALTDLKTILTGLKNKNDDQWAALVGFSNKLKDLKKASSKFSAENSEHTASMDLFRRIVDELHTFSPEGIKQNLQELSAELHRSAPKIDSHRSHFVR